MFCRVMMTNMGARTTTAPMMTQGETVAHDLIPTHLLFLMTVLNPLFPDTYDACGYFGWILIIHIFPERKEVIRHHSFIIIKYRYLQFIFLWNGRCFLISEKQLLAKFRTDRYRQ